MKDLKILSKLEKIRDDNKFEINMQRSFIFSRIVEEISDRYKNLSYELKESTCFDKSYNAIRRDSYLKLFCKKNQEKIATVTFGVIFEENKEWRADYPNIFFNIQHPKSKIGNYDVKPLSKESALDKISGYQTLFSYLSRLDDVASDIENVNENIKKLEEILDSIKKKNDKIIIPNWYVLNKKFVFYWREENKKEYPASLLEEVSVTNIIEKMQKQD